MLTDRKFSNISKFFLKRVFGLDVDALASELEEQRQQLDVAKGQEQKLKEKYHAEILSHKETTSVVESQSKQIEQLSASTKTLQEDVANYLQRMASLEDVIREKEDGLKIAQQAWVVDLAAIASYQRELRESQAQGDNSRKELSKQETALSSANKQIKELSGNLEKTLAELAVCKKTLAEEVANSKSLQKELCDGANDLSTVKRELGDKQKELDTLTATLVSLSEWACQRDEVEGELRLLKEQLAAAQTMIGQLTKERDQLRQSSKEENPEGSSQIKAFVEKLNEAEGMIQRLNEQLIALQAENRHLKGSAVTQKEKTNADIAKLNAILLARDNTIVELKARIALLERQLKEKEGDDQKKGNPSPKVIDTLKVEPGNTDDTPKPKDKTTAGFTTPVKKDVPKEGDGDEEISNADLPTLVPNPSVETKRIIEQVVDYWTNEIIDADEFFQKPNEEIISISRRLEAIAKTSDTPYLLCAKCHKPVKISKISTKRGESKFFTHCTNDGECEWRHNSESTYPPFTPIPGVDLTKITEGVSRYNKLKSLIIEALKIQKETDPHITSGVVSDKVVRGADNKRWRRADVFIRWNGKKVIFKLQRAAEGARFLQAYDAFCQSNGIYVIWIFGCESGNQYQYLLEHNYQFTFFDNKSCVFIIDYEAEQKTKQSGKLFLKCNWLVDGSHWRFTQANSGSNGILVSLEDLVFDEKGNFKPYCKEMDSMAVSETDNMVMLKENVYKFAEGALWGLFNQKEKIKTKCKYRAIDLGDDGLIHAEMADYLHPRKGILSDKGEEIETSREPIGENLFLICNFERWFLVSKEGVYITKDYESLILWCDNRLIAKDENGFSVIDFEEKDVTGKKYLSFEILSPTKARVSDHDGTYEIDRDGNIVSYTVIKLHSGFSKVCHLGKWGIKDKNDKLIVECVYNEIISFRRRFYGFTENGLIKLSNAPEYAYRIPFRATFKKMWSNDYLFEFMGNKLYMPDNGFNHANRKANTDYDVYLLNIERYEDGTNIITIAAAQKNTPNQMFNHIDKDTDFRQGEILTGKVTLAKPNRLYIEFNDGRKTYVSTNRIRKHGFKPRNYPVGATIKLEKIDFEWFYESTVWRVLA